MNFFKHVKAWLRLCVLLLTAFVTIPTVANPRNDFSFPNSESNEDVCTSMALFGTVISPIMNSPERGDTVLSALSPSALLSNSATLRNTLQSPPLLSTSLQSSFHPDLAKDMLISDYGSIGIIKAMTILILIFVVALTILFMLCLVIIATRFLPMLKFLVLKYCYPTLSDPSKRLSAGQSLPIHSPIYRIENKCTKALFGPVNLDL